MAEHRVKTIEFATYRVLGDVGAYIYKVIIIVKIIKSLAVLRKFVDYHV